MKLSDTRGRHGLLGLHPNPQAQPLLLDAVWPVLAPLLQNRGPTRTTT